MATQVLLIRHGETDWNRIKRIQGHIDIPLATSGVEQAQRLAERFAREAQAGARLDAIYSSDLLRAQQTARPFADALGLPLQLREGLRERNYGAFQGHDSDEIALRFPDDPFLRDEDRDALWGAFQVPVYAILLDHQGRLIAYECEAQAGLHIAEERVEEVRPELVDNTLCECGRAGERIGVTQMVAVAGMAAAAPQPEP